MAAFISKLCGAVALGGVIFWGTPWAPNAPIDRLDAERARRHLVDAAYEDVRVTDIDRWFTSARHGCPAAKSVAVQAWAHDAYGTLRSLTVCCDEAASPNSCAVVR